MSLSDQDREALWEAVAEVRDESPRRTDDADTWDIVDAIEPLIERHVAAALRETARYFEYDMAPAWGGDSAWISTGSHVADLVASILRERAEEIEDSPARPRP